MIRGIWFLSTCIWFSFLASCGGDRSSGSANNFKKVYTGRLNIVADAGLESIIRQQAAVFASRYDSLSVQTEFKDEASMFDDFRKGTADVLILTRALSEAEKQRLKKEDTIYIRELEIARDAIALIGNKAFDDARLDSILLKRYFNGLKPEANDPVLVFDNKNASIVKHLFKWAGSEGKAPANVYAAATTEDVVNYVEQQPNSIGFIPYGYVSDEDEAGMQTLTKRVKILSLRSQNEEGKAIRVSANQSDIATGEYPLTRSVNAVIRYGHLDNPEWLFMNFLFREKGAKVFLKAGFVPAKMPERDIIVNTGEMPITK